MKKTTILYWIFTGTFAAFMVFTSVPDVLKTEQTIDFMHNQLGYPLYIIPFLGYAKIAGVIALLIPGFPRIKEWAYAGLAFDLIGAAYSVIATSGILAASFFILPLFVGGLSYLFYHKKLRWNLPA